MYGEWATSAITYSSCGWKYSRFVLSKPPGLPGGDPGLVTGLGDGFGTGLPGGLLCPPLFLFLCLSLSFSLLASAGDIIRRWSRILAICSVIDCNFSSAEGCLWWGEVTLLGDFGDFGGEVPGDPDISGVASWPRGKSDRRIKQPQNRHREGRGGVVFAVQGSGRPVRRRRKTSRSWSLCSCRCAMHAYAYNIGKLLNATVYVR
jgi:hypothetical protein